MTGAKGTPLRITAVIPALNEAPAIGRTVAGLRALDGVIERVIVVDNGSTDDTATLARAAGADVVHEDRRGYGQACLAGVLAAANADVILLLDGDAADDPTDIPRVLAPLLQGKADLVVGSRSLGSRERGAMTPQQLIGNALVARIMWWRYGVRVTDLGPLRAIRRADLLALAPQELTYGWSVEMMAKAALAGYRYQEVPVSYRRRVGVSKVGGTLQGSIRAGWSILATVLRHRNWHAPPTTARVLEGR
jgi:glycosyltransferase involved in cell wall biosynthesis